jgi:hypothetical protein
MNLVVAISIVTVLALALALAMIVRNLGSTRQYLPVTAQWIEELSIERYKPMMSLLEAGEFEGQGSRAERCVIFRGHLHDLNMDFRRVCMALKIMMVQSEQDRPDLAAALIRHQIMFAWGMTVVSARLFLFQWSNCNVDVTGMVRIFDVMRLELRSLVPPGAPVFA